MKAFLIIPFTLMFFTSIGQIDGDPCDSIFIHSVAPNTTGIQIEVLTSNHSADIMSYPGFILLMENGDTIAIEEVNYFGIGWNEQTHILNIVNPPTLPMSVILELHTHFYDSLRCSWDLTLGSTSLLETEAPNIRVFPNPAEDYIMIKNAMPHNLSGLRVVNAIGEIMETKIAGNKINTSNYSNGLYYVEYIDESEYIRIKFTVQ